MYASDTGDSTNSGPAWPQGFWFVSVLLLIAMSVAGVGILAPNFTAWTLLFCLMLAIARRRLFFIPAASLALGLMLSLLFAIPWLDIRLTQAELAPYKPETVVPEAPITPAGHILIEAGLAPLEDGPAPQFACDHHCLDLLLFDSVESVSFARPVWTPFPELEEGTAPLATEPLRYSMARDGECGQLLEQQRSERRSLNELPGAERDAAIERQRRLGAECIVSDTGRPPFDMRIRAGRWKESPPTFRTTSSVLHVFIGGPRRADKEISVEFEEIRGADNQLLFRRFVPQKSRLVMPLTVDRVFGNSLGSFDLVVAHRSIRMDDDDPDAAYRALAYPLQSMLWAARFQAN